MSTESPAITNYRNKENGRYHPFARCIINTEKTVKTF